ncbi:MAG: phage DNA encapsidation protein [Paraclostridium sp.]
MYYNYDRVMSYNALFNFIMTNRGLGKTYGAKKRVINNFLKKGEMFVYVRRYKTELKKKELFFKDIESEFPELEFEIKGNTAYINKKPCGYFIPLSTSLIEKSNAYPKVSTIIFDEFVIDKGHLRYLSSEVTIFLELYETIARKRNNCRVLFLANNVSKVNPYFTYFECIPKTNNRFNLFKDGEILVEMFTNEEFTKSKENTRFGKLIKGTIYGDYNINNKSLRDSDTFILPKKPKDSTFMFSVKHNEIELGYWISDKENIIYCNNQIDKTSKNRYSLSKNSHDVDLIMYDKLNEFTLFKSVVVYFKNGKVRFKDIQIKTASYEIFQLMGVR